MLKISQAAKYLGVHPDTLRKWERQGKITPSRTVHGQRRYTLAELNAIKEGVGQPIGSNIIYCRVSSRKQSEDLERQVEFMQRLFPKYEVITDIGSGINFNRPGLQTLLEQICKGSVSRIAIGYKDRLCRIGFDLFEQISRMFGCEIIIVNNVETSPEQELVEDFIAITTSFSERIHGLRKYGDAMSTEILASQQEAKKDLGKLDEPVLQNIQQKSPVTENSETAEIQAQRLG